MKLCLCVITLLFAGVVRAELPPGSYDKLRIEADEAVIIKVASVKTVVSGGHKDVTVEAEVLGIERSKSGLKKGDAVTIRYAVATTPIPGPRPVPVLDKDGVYPAFLRKAGKSFEPAAYGESFKMMPDL